MKTIISVAVAGMGHWGKNLVRNFHQIGSLHTVCDSDASREATIREQYKDVKFTTDYRSVLDDRSISAVVIAVPAAAHAEMVEAALEAGKDVLVEKPLALTFESGQALVDLAKREKRVLMVGHILQYHPAVIRLLQLVRAGELGRIQYVYSNRLNIGKIRTEENILWSFAPHDISVILAILQEMPDEVACRGEAYLNHRVPDVTLSDFHFPSGVRAHVFVNWLHPFKEQRLVVVGSEQMAVFDDTADEKLVLYPHKVEWRNRIPTAVKADAKPEELPEQEPLRAECEHFLKAVETREVPKTNGDEGLRVLQLLDLCQKSLDSNGTPLSVNVQGEKKTPFFVHETAVVDEPCEIGAGTKVWHFSHVMKGAKIGERCIFGQNCNVDGGVVVGNNVKVQNNVSLYTGLVVEDDVFLGPSCVLTNVTNPRSQVVRHGLYETTILKRGCSIGANATVVCGITVGRYAFVGAGAVVTKDVPDYALMMGVPAKRVGWISRHGLPLRSPDKDGVMTCPESRMRYKEVESGVLKCLDLDEDALLPENLREGNAYYDDLVHGGHLTVGE